MLRLVLLFCCVMAFSCENDKQGFTGTQGSTEADGLKRDTPPEECIDSGSTKAFLLTKNVQNGSREQVVSYRLEVNDCPGSLKEVAGTVKFDAKATLVPFDAPIPYKVLDPSDESVISSGQLQLVRFKDLFGNSGDDVGYYQTEKFSVETGVSSIILNIDVSGMYFTPQDLDTGGLSTTEISGEFTIPTFLSVSSAAPVEQDVIFISAPKKPAN